MHSFKILFRINSFNVPVVQCPFILSRDNYYSDWFECAHLMRKCLCTFGGLLDAEMHRRPEYVCRPFAYRTYTNIYVVHRVRTSIVSCLMCVIVLPDHFDVHGSKRFRMLGEKATASWKRSTSSQTAHKKTYVYACNLIYRSDGGQYPVSTRESWINWILNMYKSLCFFPGAKACGCVFRYTDFATLLIQTYIQSN